MITEHLINGPYKAMFKETFRETMGATLNERLAEEVALEVVLSHALLQCAAAKREMNMVDDIRTQFSIPTSQPIFLTPLPQR